MALNAFTELMKSASWRKKIAFNGHRQFSTWRAPLGEVYPSKWIEIRPLPTSRLSAGNFMDILGVLYNSGRPFKFVIASCPSPIVEGRLSVRFFFQADGMLVDRVKSLLRTNLGAQVIEGSKPPKSTYPLSAELGLRSHFALPIADLTGKMRSNPIDAVAAALTKGEGAIEISAVGDTSARRKILNWIMEKTRRSPSFADVLLDSVLSIFDAILGAPPRGSAARAELNPVAKARVSAATEKANRKLFRCSVKVYGDREVLDAVLDVLPSSAVNRFARRGIRKGAVLSQLVEKPPTYALRNAINSLAWLPPIALLGILFLAGIFDPLRLANIDIALIILAFSLAAGIKMAIPNRRPIILSAEELSLIVGLPTEVGRLPVELGTSPVTRGQFIPAEGAVKEAQAEVYEGGVEAPQPAVPKAAPREGGGRFPTAQILCPFCGTPLPSVREPCPRCGREIRGGMPRWSHSFLRDLPRRNIHE